MRLDAGAAANRREAVPAGDASVRGILRALAPLGREAELLAENRRRLRPASQEEAQALWKGLIEGAWSLLDHVESGGKRFVLTRRNPIGASDPNALTPRERAVLAFAAMGRQNKYIAYALGLSPSTVAAHLRSACRKLGFASRREVILSFAPLVAPAADRAPRPRDRRTAAPSA